jgi:hypothetical protein
MTIAPEDIIHLDFDLETPLEPKVDDVDRIKKKREQLATLVAPHETRFQKALRVIKEQQARYAEEDDLAAQESGHHSMWDWVCNCSPSRGELLQNPRRNPVESFCFAEVVDGLLTVTVNRWDPPVISKELAVRLV